MIISIERYFQGVEEFGNSFLGTTFQVTTWALEVVGLLFGKNGLMGFQKSLIQMTVSTKKNKKRNVSKNKMDQLYGRRER